MSEPAKGPWKWREINPKDKKWGACEITSGKSFVATHICGVANARLIAAAPELLESLKGVLRVADRNTVEFDAARAAVFKATEVGL